MLFLAQIRACIIVSVVLVGHCGYLMLPGIFEVAFDCIFRLSYFVGVFLRASSRSIKVTPVDGSCPCVL